MGITENHAFFHACYGGNPYIFIKDSSYFLHIKFYMCRGKVKELFRKQKGKKNGRKTKENVLFVPTERGL